MGTEHAHGQGGRGLRRTSGRIEQRHTPAFSGQGCTGGGPGQAGTDHQRQARFGVQGGIAEGGAQTECIGDLARVKLRCSIHTLVAPQVHQAAGGR